MLYLMVYFVFLFTIIRKILRIPFKSSTFVVDFRKIEQKRLEKYAYFICCEQLL